MNTPTKNQFLGTLTASGITLALGILFTAKPMILAEICKFAGIALCVAAAVLVALYFIQKREDGSKIVYGILAVAAGILLIVLPGLLSFLIPIFFGAWILISSAAGMYRNFAFRRQHRFWWVGLTLCTLGALLGAYVITRPVQTLAATVRIIGIVMIVFSALRVISAFMARQYYADAPAGDVIDVTANKD